MISLFNNKTNRPWMSFMLTAVMISGCAQGTQTDPQGKDVVAYVNKEPIFTSELRRSIALSVRQDPLHEVTAELEQDQLEGIIDKKLIIQAAVAQGLARDEEFVETIKTFWEQTLVREFLNYKRQEFADYLYATDEEVSNFYARLGKRTTFKYIKSTNKNKIDQAYKTTVHNAQEDIFKWESIGPVTYDEVTSDVLRQAFSLPLGDVVKIEDGVDYYLIKVEQREDVTQPALSVLKPDIEREIIAMKEQQLFDSWLDDRRKNAAIKILNK